MRFSIKKSMRKEMWEIQGALYLILAQMLFSNGQPVGGWVFLLWGSFTLAASVFSIKWRE